jgi:peptidoglycan/xylan/chitin deacetylase (PgdA/CDA1 family)
MPPSSIEAPMKKLISFFLILFSFLPMMGWGATYCATTTGTKTSGTSTPGDWSNANCYASPRTVLLNNALSAADTIYVAGGTYAGTGTAAVSIGTDDDGVNIIGSADPLNPTIFDGTTNNNEAFYAPSGAVGASISHITFKAGSSSVYLAEIRDSVTLDHVTFDASKSKTIYVNAPGKTITINNHRISGNGATMNGWYILAGTVNLRGGVITGCNGTYTGSLILVSGSGSVLNSNNNNFTELCSGIFNTSTSGVINSTNDAFWGNHKAVASSTTPLFNASTGTTITVDHALIVPGGRTPRASYISGGSGTVTITNPQQYVYPKIIRHKRGGVISVTTDSVVKSYVDAVAAQGDAHGIPVSFAVNKDGIVSDSSSKWAATESEAKTLLYALTQPPHVSHEIVNHTISHPHLCSNSGLTVTYTGGGTGMIKVAGTYPNKIVTLNTSGDGDLITFDCTVTDYGVNHRDLSTIYGLRMAINDYGNGWSTVANTSKALHPAGLKVGDTVVTTGTNVPLDIDTNYDHWKYEITAMTEWLDGIFGTGYTKGFAYPYAERAGIDYTDALQAWLNNNTASTHVYGARTMDQAELSAPYSGLLSESINLMGIGTIATSSIVIPDSATATETTIRNNARAFAAWIAETGAIGSLAVHESECSATQLGYILDELKMAQDVQFMTFGNLMVYIRTSGLWTDTGSGVFTRSPVDLSDYRLRCNSPAKGAGLFVAGVHDAVGCKTMDGKACYRGTNTVDIGAYGAVCASGGGFSLLGNWLF